ncbi:MAG: class I SAM-dependent methyltransferase, partial [Candidatus Auribacterota bacterium]|nr:class I SAM-dependent methyltransferase [Candidatus Auribacterota bacterium]
ILLFTQRIMKLIESLLNNPLLYRLHASGVDRAKFAAIRKIRADFTGLKVLDLGCGPGNTTHIFSGSNYTGVDINEKYIKIAAERYPCHRFTAGDAGDVKWGEGFDIILINSFFHHLDDNEVVKVSKAAASALSDGGTVIVQEPLIPEKNELYHRLMMKLDRGSFFRSLDQWKGLLREAGLIPEQVDLYHLRIMGIRGYHMVSMSLVGG